MTCVISQHLLASELGAVETQMARLRAPLGDSEALMRMSLASNQEHTLSDCKHLEVTLQAVRCEHTAADAALQSALQHGDELLREASARLFLAQDQLTTLDASAAAHLQTKRRELHLRQQQKDGQRGVVPAALAYAPAPATPASAGRGVGAGYSSYAAAMGLRRQSSGGGASGALSGGGGGGLGVGASPSAMGPGCRGEDGPV